MSAGIVEYDNSETKKSFIVYKVGVNYRNNEWFVLRRYNEFNALSDKLKKAFPDGGFKIPGKRLFAALDPNFIKQRKEGLNDFIQKIMAHSEALETPEVKEFLGINKQIFSDENEDLMETDSKNEETAEDNVFLGQTENKKARASDFEFLKVIGKGSFGKVYIARHKNEDRIYAVKVLSKEQIKRRNEVKHIMSERNVLVKSLRHPFLCTLHFSFQTGTKLYFILDYVNGGELFFHLQRERSFSERRSQFYCAEMATALGYLHSHDIIYRDLKPENILLSNEGHIVLTDFGLCKEGIDSSKKTSTFCGTPEYLAPEVLRKEPYDKAVDWWCLGSVLYEMLFGLPPFYSRDTTEMYQNILTKPLKMKSNCSPAASSIIIGLLKKDKRIRLGTINDFEDIRNHEFFNSLDWVALENKKIPPPFKPRVHSESDTRNIDPEFTGEAVSQSVGRSMDPNRAIGASVDDNCDTFQGFTYVPPSNEAFG